MVNRSWLSLSPPFFADCETDTPPCLNEFIRPRLQNWPVSSLVRGAMVLSELSGSNFLVPYLCTGLRIRLFSRSVVLKAERMLPFSGMWLRVTRNAGISPPSEGFRLCTLVDLIVLKF